MDECRKEYENWVKEYALNVEPFIDTIDCKSAFYAAWKVGHEKGFSDGAASACNELANCHQSEIDALKAQVEGLILQAGDMEKLAIEHMLERDAALIQVDELKVQVEELKADAGCIVSCDDGSLVTVREFHKDIQTIANTVIAEAEEKDG